MLNEVTVAPDGSLLRAMSWPSPDVLYCDVAAALAARGGDVQRLPYCLRVVAENVARHLARTGAEGDAAPTSDLDALNSLQGGTTTDLTVPATDPAAPAGTDPDTQSCPRVIRFSSKSARMHSPSAA